MMPAPVGSTTVHRLRLLALLLLCALLPSCAAIVCKKTALVPVDSVPLGAIVSYRGANVGITPCTVEVHRRDTRLVLKCEGHHEQVLELGTATSAWVWGNLVFGGIIGLIVDLAGGGATIVREGPCLVELTPLDEPLPAIWVRPERPTRKTRYGTFVEDDSAPVVPTRAPPLQGAPLHLRSR